APTAPTTTSTSCLTSTCLPSCFSTRSSRCRCFSHGTFCGPTNCWAALSWTWRRCGRRQTTSSTTSGRC
ncbi:Protein of unknown function, partial [Gryllus bimaculatus]